MKTSDQNNTRFLRKPVFLSTLVVAIAAACLAAAMMISYTRDSRALKDIRNQYAPEGFSQFKIEGRSLGSALILEFLLYYMTKPEHQLEVREHVYLDSSLDLF